MADLTTVRGKVSDALDEADTALGNQPNSQLVAALQAQVTKLQGIIDKIRADLG